MEYNKEESSRYLKMAGRISAAAAFAGLLVFLIAFVIDLGSHELNKVSAQTASTTLTVLNTPPEFYVNAYEAPDSATTSPVNSGDVMQWEAIAYDSNDAPYFLLICSDNASPTADYLDVGNGTGIGEPQCNSPIQWGVSAATPSETLATVSTTTASTSISQFSEINDWYAWVCDDDAVNPRCSNLFAQGPTTTTASSSPFHVNNRPNFVNLDNDGPVDPGGTITWLSTSSDPDTSGGFDDDDLILIVCSDNSSYNSTTNSCGANEIASTTIVAQDDATASDVVASILQDQAYQAYGYLIDEHGHESSDNPIQSNFVVNNVPPVVLGGDIILNAASTTLNLTVPGGETPGFTLDFKVRDANSCVNAPASTTEITGYNVALFRYNENSTSTCDGVTPGHYDPNDCYTTGVATTTWDLDCTVDWATQCTGPAVDQLDYTCTFPLWFVADPTDNGPETPLAFEQDIWSVGVAGIDDNSATSSMATTSNPRELVSFTALELLTAEIAYGSLEPGENSSTTNATSTVLSVGNTGLDQEVTGESMCGTFSATTTCPSDPTSTIPESEQEFSGSAFGYGSGTDLSSTSNQQVEINVPKTISTSSPSVGDTYWGIAVPASITISGDYRGLNTFFGVVSEAGEW